MRSTCSSPGGDRAFPRLAGCHDRPLVASTPPRSRPCAMWLPPSPPEAKRSAPDTSIASANVGVTDSGTADKSATRMMRTRSTVNGTDQDVAHGSWQAPTSSAL